LPLRRAGVIVECLLAAAQEAAELWSVSGTPAPGGGVQAAPPFPLFSLLALTVAVLSALASWVSALAAKRSAKAATRTSLCVLTTVDKNLGRPLPPSYDEFSTELEILNDGREMVVLSKPTVGEDAGFSLQSWSVKVTLASHPIYTSDSAAVPVPPNHIAVIRLSIAFRVAEEEAEARGRLLFPVSPRLDNGSNTVAVPCVFRGASR
jgi:hypothetical protein